MSILFSVLHEYYNSNTGGTCGGKLLFSVSCVFVMTPGAQAEGEVHVQYSSKTHYNVIVLLWSFAV